ncbi:hypothetical protein [Rariglobus hedericola]|uniref:hypothetical protein n=1 Tax=Rariglobus hedericola TaxID=2597822 RepID=UPI001396A45B|nr:hypothetical protein [Rariglobus hedericola]
MKEESFPQQSYSRANDNLATSATWFGAQERLYATIQIVRARLSRGRVRAARVIAA